MDINSGNLQLDNSILTIDENLLSKIKFIKEGKFVINNAAPAIKLIGTIDNINFFRGMVVTTPKLKAIEQDDLIRSFLNNEDVENPIEYIKVIMNSQSAYQPIYFFIDKAQETLENIINYIENNCRHTSTVDLLINRLNFRKIEQEMLKKVIKKLLKIKLDIEKNGKSVK